jgi:hypothetical protein
MTLPFAVMRPLARRKELAAGLRAKAELVAPLTGMRGRAGH